MTRWTLAVALLLVPQVASAASCVNRFVQRREAAGRWVVTLLTGHLTFQEAQALSKEIKAKRAAPIDWVDEKGRTIARQISDLRVMRPMPVACGDKTSGSIMVLTFLAARAPTTKMIVKFAPGLVVPFDEQKE